MRRIFQKFSFRPNCTFLGALSVDVTTPPEALDKVKEALVKATGHGLSMPMTAITLAPDRPAVERWTGPGAPSGPMWLHDLSPAADHPAAVAGPGERAPEIAEADGDAVLRT